MIHPTWILNVLLVPLAVASAAKPEEAAWEQPTGAVEAWTMQPGWLSNASPTAAVTREGKTVCFAVNEPRRGMKWSASVPAVWLADLPYLVIRYRAENLDHSGTDYLFYLDDKVPGRQLHALRPRDLVGDGQWHLVAVDVSRLTSAETVTAIAVQVQADRQGKARLWLDRLAFTEEPPSDATILPAPSPTDSPSDLSIPVTTLPWKPQNGWLANPAAVERCRVESAVASVVFHVTEPGRGMKWSADLPEPVALEGRRYLSLRYRARRNGAHGDYVLCALGKPPPGAEGFVAAISPAELIVDGRWHTLNVDLRHLVARLTTLTGVAFQVQATGADARLEVSDVQLVHARRPSPLSDALAWQAGATWTGFQELPFECQDAGRSDAWRSHLRLEGWFTDPATPAPPGVSSGNATTGDSFALTAEGIPFSLKARPPDLAVTPLRDKAELIIPVDRSGSEVYLLLLARMIGPEEPVYGGGRLRAINDVDRFRLRLNYADGQVDECLPMNAATGRFGLLAGPQVVVASLDPARRLASIVLCDATRQAAFGVAAITVRVDPSPLHREAREDRPPMKLLPAKPTAQAMILEAVTSLDGPPRIERLVHGPSGWNYLGTPCSLVDLDVDGKSIAASDWEPVAKAADRADVRWYRVRSVDGLQIGVTVKTGATDSLSVAVQCENRGGREHRVTLRSPHLTYRLTEEPDEAFYLVPRCGANMDHRDGSFRERYCGAFPVQFLDTFSPGHGRGLSLRTEDTQCVRKHYLLTKKGNTFTLGVEYPEQTLKPGGRFQTPAAVVTATDGDCHRGLAAYRRWLSAWYRPQSPRKPWFREVFNFRQRFLWSLDPLYDTREGVLRLERAIDEARSEFGGIDYLHLFDWGNCGSYGRIYGRTGDYSPYDELRGGRESLRKAIAAVQAQKVPVGLYIEGYLLEERGKLGQASGRKWQLTAPGGKGQYWPQSTEMVVCPEQSDWQDVQSSTYATKAQELAVDGMYLDEFGFAGSNHDCWSAEHGHAVPSYAVTAERDLTRAVRRRLDAASPNVALYSEESPVDVTSQHQDGSFTYAMFSAQRSPSEVPLNLTRFALPDFKTIEILFCDGPTGSWATGVKWVFFNGEAIWLEGPAKEWFEPETRAAIRRCYAILHEHRDAFTTLRPVPLFPTEQGGLFCNAFPADAKTVYTFYNSRHSTLRGPVVRLPHRDGVSYHDAWNNRPARVSRAGADDVVDLDLGPLDVGCLVVRDALGSRGDDGVLRQTATRTLSLWRQP